MSTMIRDTAETSVTFSLAELAKLEEERVREQDTQRARARELAARTQREAAAQKRATEAAQIAAEAEARARRERGEAEEKARVEAREQAAIEVARIGALAKARLEVDSATRAHELAVIHLRAESGRRGVQRALAAVLGVVLCGGAVAAYQIKQHVAGVEQSAERLREGQSALAQERDHARATELAALDRRRAALLAHPRLRDAEEARVTAEAARSAVDARALDHDHLRAFGDALDALQARLETLDRVAALDRRHADLAAWAAQRRRSEITAAAGSAAARAKAMSNDEGALRVYEGALDKLRDALAESAVASGARPVHVISGPGCDPHDPLCGLDGRPL
jgi:hypothetical protein